MTVLTLTNHFERYEAFAEKCMMCVEKVKRIWENTPFYVGKVMSDTHSKDLLHALEESASAASTLSLAAGVFSKHICMEA